MANEIYSWLGQTIGYDNAFAVYNAVTGVPFIGTALKAYDQYSYLTDYFGNTGLSWSDVKYPTRTAYGQSLSSVGSSSYNFVSSNIMRLYR